jgi:hypothetical protein
LYDPLRCFLYRKKLLPTIPINPKITAVLIRATVVGVRICVGIVVGIGVGIGVEVEVEVKVEHWKLVGVDVDVVLVVVVSKS